MQSICAETTSSLHILLHKKRYKGLKSHEIILNILIMSTQEVGLPVDSAIPSHARLPSFIPFYFKEAILAMFKRNEYLTVSLRVFTRITLVFFQKMCSYPACIFANLLSYKEFVTLRPQNPIGMVALPSGEFCVSRKFSSVTLKLHWKLSRPSGKNSR